ncbi:MAG: ATP-binding cassette domain-containing protein [Crocinitomicaceae bacterium]|nr:ATP-binding cassette domain-containing protein [Crocinitomicaceae bacterium]
MLNLSLSKLIRSEKGQELLQVEASIATDGVVSGIYGASGQGKSTLFNMIVGITKPDQGTISFNGVDWHTDHSRLPIQKRNIGYIFQGNSLFQHFTVKKNILYALSKEEQKSCDLNGLLEQLGLSNLKDQYPHQLSGGQCQRVAIARAIAQKAELILMDEPFTGLDIKTKHRLYKELKTFKDEHNLTILMITHDVNDIYALCDQVYELENHKLLPGISASEFRIKTERMINQL